MSHASSASRRAQDVADAAQHLAEAESILSRSAEVPAVSSALAQIAATRRALAQIPVPRAPTPRRGKLETGPSLVARRQLPAAATSARAAREFCDSTLRSWSVPERVRANTTDVASELVANAVRVATAPIVITFELQRDAIVVRVWDNGPGAPQIRPYRVGVSERGVGLRLVKQLSAVWGWEATADGKVVWARVTNTSAAEANEQSP